MPLHTIRADLDYGTAQAQTTYGIIGIKVWIFKGEILGNSEHTTALHNATSSESEKRKISKKSILTLSDVDLKSTSNNDKTTSPDE